MQNFWRNGLSQQFVTIERLNGGVPGARSWVPGPNRALQAFPCTSHADPPPVPNAVFPSPQLPHSHTSRQCRATSLSCCSAGRPLLSCCRGGRCATWVLASLSEISGHNAYLPRPPPTATGAPRSRRSHLPNGPTWDATTIPCHPLQGTLCEHQEIKNFAPGTRCHHYWKEAPSSCHR